MASNDALKPSSTHAPSYYAATVREQAQVTPFVAGQQTDVCVIGGGYAGLSTALHLARHKVAVTLLEQSRLGWGASGRNGGQVHVGMRREQQWLEQRMGKEAAAGMWRLALDARAHLDWLMDTYDIQCDFRPGYLHANHRARFDAETREHVQHMQEHYDYQYLRYVDRDEMRAMVGSPGYFSGSLDERGGHLHALNYALGIARAAATEGAILHEGVHVTNIRRDATGWIVETGQGTIKAARVVMACNGYMQGLSPPVERHVLPINNFIAVTAPLGAERARSLIRDGCAVSDSRFVVNYFRITPDERLLFGGGENYSFHFPRDIAGFVRPHMLGVYPQLQDVAIDYAWGGTLAITPTRMPWIRQLQPGLFNASGFSGLGVLMAPFAGKMVADAMCGDAAGFELLASAPVPQFPGGPALRYPTMVAAMLFYAFRDRL